MQSSPRASEIEKSPERATEEELRISTNRPVSSRAILFALHESIVSVCHRDPSAAATKLNNSPPIPLRRPSRRQNLKLTRGSSLSRYFHPHLFADLSLLIQLLRFRRRSAHVAEP